MQPNALATFKSLFPCIFKAQTVTIRDSTVRESDLHDASLSSMPDDFHHHDVVDGDTTVVTSKMGENELEYIINDKNGDANNPNPGVASSPERTRTDSTILMSMYSKSSVHSGGSGVGPTAGPSKFTISPIQRPQQQQPPPLPGTLAHSSTVHSTGYPHTTQPHPDELDPDITRGSECSDGSHYVI